MILRQPLLALLVFAPTLAGCAGAGPSGVAGGLVYSQTVHAGARARLGDYRTFSTARGCPTVSLPEVTILRAPDHGRVSFGAGPARFVANKPVTHPCQRGDGMATIVYYTPHADYRGPDLLSYRVRFMNGETHHIRKRLVVR